MTLFVFKSCAWDLLLLDYKADTVYDTVSDVVESEVHQCQQNSDA